MIPSALENHLWQSTLCVAVAWLLTVALRKNRAAVRYWLWFAASVKFLIPFSWLASIGGKFAWRSASAIAQPQWTLVMNDLGHPFDAPATTASFVPAAIPHSSVSLAAVLSGIWLCGVLVSVGVWLRSWRKMRAAMRKATPLALDLPIPTLSTASRVEPGVFGIFRPVLLLPAGITERLTGAQLDAIAAHEMCHVRRHDNLTAAFHMFVQGIFWFHPALWWIGTRLVEERERACDEEVLRRGSEPEVYAEGILTVCKFYVEAPLACASGISGADLKKRIVRIMTGRFADGLSFRRKLLLVALAIAALTGPVIFGLANTPRVRAQSQETSPALLPAFEVASIKANHSGTPNRFFRFADPSRINITNMPAKDLIQFAYHVQPFQVSGGPGWITSDGYDIEAKVDDSVVAELQKLPPEQRIGQFRLMLQSLLADRFKLTLGHETKELPIYALVVTKGGAKLTPTTVNPDVPPSPKAQAPPQGPMMMMSPGKLTAKLMPMSALAEVLGRQSELGGRLVVDRTALTGKYDFTLEFAPERPEPLPGTTGGPPMSPQGPPPPDASAPSIFTAIQEQLGLKLESTKGPVEVLVVNTIEKPSEN
jgi:bla regulator protein blaR1